MKRLLKSLAFFGTREYLFKQYFSSCKFVLYNRILQAFISKGISLSDENVAKYVSENVFSELFYSRRNFSLDILEKGKALNGFTHETDSESLKPLFDVLFTDSEEDFFSKEIERKN